MLDISIDRVLGTVVCYLFTGLFVWQGNKRKWPLFRLDRNLTKREFLHRWLLVLAIIAALLIFVIYVEDHPFKKDSYLDWIFVAMVPMLGLLKGFMISTVLQRANMLKMNHSFVKNLIYSAIGMDLVGVLKIDALWIGCVYLYFAKENEVSESKVMIHS